MATWTAKAPECLPLTSTEELFQWRPDAVDEICKCWVPLDQVPAPDRERLLACHDMRGGYLEDRLAQGGGDSDFYAFRHWHAIDLFVYFSHSLVLGTLITEWDAGAAKCRQLFGSVAAAERTAAQLAAIAQTHGFDGWIVNIENPLDKEHVPHVIHFLRMLTGMLREASPAAQVIWYDAVTVEGQLRWQDSLTELNRPFLDASTGIWINYTWKEGTPQAVRAAAGERQHDVYMGVDVFGRGTFGGGGFNCDVALHAAKAAGLSAALFAVAWPFDAEPAEGDPRSWQERDEALWGSISEAWRGHRPLTRQLPLYTDFSLGRGTATMYRGSRQQPAAWYNLSRQGLLPSLRVRPAALLGMGWPAAVSAAGGAAGAAGGEPPQHGILRAAPTLQTAYSGGSCIEVAGTLQGPQLVSLFHTAIPAPDAGLEVGYAAATYSGVHVALLLNIHTSSASGVQGELSHVLLLPRALGSSPSLMQLLLAAAGSRPTAVKALLPLQERMDIQLGLDGMRKEEDQDLQWVRRQYRVYPTDLPAPPEQCLVSGVDLLVLPDMGDGGGERTAARERMYLGELWMGELGAPAPPCSVAGLACSGLRLLGPGGQPQSLLPSGAELFACLSWSMPAAARCCHVYCSFHWGEYSGGQGEEPQWLGVAVGPAFRVHSQLVPQGAAAVTFYTQPLSGHAGKLQPWEQAACVVATLPAAQL